MHVRALDPVPLVRHMIGADMCRVDERDDGLMGPWKSQRWTIQRGTGPIKTGRCARWAVQDPEGQSRDSEALLGL